MLKTLQKKIEKMKMSRYIPIIGLFVLMIIILTSFGSGFGVSTSYWDDKPIKIAPGESKTVVLGLQNGVGSEDLTFAAKLENDGDGIASTEEKDYFVPLGTEIGIPIELRIPEDANIGDKYTIVISFREIAAGEEGVLRVAGAVTSKFPVEIVGEEESELYQPGAKKGLSGFWVIVIALVVALIIFVIAKKRKK